MIGRLDVDDLLGFGQPGKERVEFGARAEFVMRTLDEYLGNGARFQVFRTAHASRESGGQEPARGNSRRRARHIPGKLAAQPRDHAGAKGETRQSEGKAGIAVAQPGEGGPAVLNLAREVAMHALAAAHAAEVESQHDGAGAP